MDCNGFCADSNGRIPLEAEARTQHPATPWQGAIVQSKDKWKELIWKEAKEPPSFVKPYACVQVCCRLLNSRLYSEKLCHVLFVLPRFSIICASKHISLISYSVYLNSSQLGTSLHKGRRIQQGILSKPKGIVLTRCFTLSAVRLQAWRPSH